MKVYSPTIKLFSRRIDGDVRYNRKFVKGDFSRALTKAAKKAARQEGRQAAACLD